MRSRMGGSRLGVAAAMTVAALTGTAHAEPPEPGTWRAGATSTDVKIERWDPACGEAPKSGRAEGTGTVTLQRDGSAIVIDARGREIRTGTCWSRNPSIRRVSTQAGGGVWETQCKTPEGDPHEEHGRYTFRLSSNGELIYADESTFHWKLGDAVCAATTTTTQTFTRVEGEAAEAAGDTAAAEQATAETAADACEPGPAAKIVLRPAQANIELGERVCFRASAVDAADCPASRAAMRWSLDHPDGIVGRLEDGCFVAGERAAEAEGTFRVVAAIGDVKATATVQVKAADLSSLLAKRVEEVGESAAEQAAAKAAAVPPAPPQSAAKVDTSARAASTGAETDRLLAIASAVAFVVVLLGWLGFVRSRRRREAAVATADERAVATTTRPAAPSMAPADNWICPTCRVGYPQTVTTCPKDGTALVPWRQFAESRRPAPLERGKRCPKCGRRYDAESAFCTDDGSALVPTD